MERWKINLYVIWISQTLSLMSFGFGIPFIPLYIQDLGVTDSNNIKMYVGILSAAPAITMGIMAPIWGILADKYGRKLMLLRAMAFASVVIGGMGLVANVDQLILLRLAQGVFTGTITAATVLVATGTPNHRLAFALGFLSSSTFIGQSVGPVVGGFVAEMLGYRVSFYIGAILMIFDFFLVLFFVKESKAPLEPIQEQKVTRSSFFSIFTTIIVVMLAILFFMRVGRTVFAPYIPLYVQDFMHSKAEGTAGITGLISGFIALMTAISGLTLSRLGDRHDKIKLMSILLVSGIVLSLPLMWVNNLWLFTLLYGILFFSIGGIEPVIISITVEHTPIERRGVLFGIQGLVGSLGWAVAPIFGGQMSVWFSLKAVLLLIPMFLLVSFITMLWARKLK